MTIGPSQSPGVAGAVCQCTMQNPPPPKTEPCKHNGLMVTCSHGRHIFVSDYSLLRRDILEVVAGHSSKMEEIECITEIISGPCKEGLNTLLPHDGKVFDLSHKVQDPGAILSSSNDKLKFRAKCAPFDLERFYEFIWPANTSVSHYFVYVNSCEGEELIADVAVYPELQWKITGGIGFRSFSDDQKYQAVGADKGKKVDNKSSKEVTDESFSSNLSVSVTYGSETYELSGEFKKYTKHCISAVNTTKSMVDHIAPRMQKFGGIKLTVDFPKIQLTVGDWHWKEIEGSPKCGFYYNIVLDFDPLLGLTGEVDLLTALLNATGPVGGTLNYIRDLLKGDESLSVDVYIKATMNGKMSGKFSFSKEASAKSAKVSGEISTPVTCTIEGGGEVKGKVLFVKAGASVKVGGKSSVTPSLKAAGDERGPFFEGKVLFSGIEIYWSAMYGLESSIEKKKPEDKESKAGKYTKTTSEGSELSGKAKYENKKEGEWTFIEPAEWFKDKKYFFNNM